MRVRLYERDKVRETICTRKKPCEREIVRERETVQERGEGDEKKETRKVPYSDSIEASLDS